MPFEAAICVWGLACYVPHLSREMVEPGNGAWAKDDSDRPTLYSCVQSDLSSCNLKSPVANNPLCTLYCPCFTDKQTEPELLTKDLSQVNPQLVSNGWGLDQMCLMHKSCSKSGVGKLSMKDQAVNILGFVHHTDLYHILFFVFVISYNPLKLF